MGGFQGFKAARWFHCAEVSIGLYTLAHCRCLYWILYWTAESFFIQNTVLQTLIVYTWKYTTLPGFDDCTVSLSASELKFHLKTNTKPGARKKQLIHSVDNRIIYQ